MDIKTFFELLIEDVASFQYEYNIVTFKYKGKVHEVNILGNLENQYKEIFNPENI